MGAPYIDYNRRVSIVTMRHSGTKFPDIARELNLEPNTCAKIYCHATQKYSSQEKENISLDELLKPENLAPNKPPGHPKALTDNEENHLIKVTKMNAQTHHLPLQDLQLSAGLTSVSNQTICNTLHNQGLKAYKENLNQFLSLNTATNNLHSVKKKLIGDLTLNGQIGDGLMRCG